MAKGHWVQRFGSGAWLAVAVACGLALMTLPVLAQFGQRGGGGIFDSFFGPFSGPPRGVPSERPADYSRAPPPRKLDAPATSVMVFGDSMADWLAYGLEDAQGDSPEFGVIRKNRATAGLIRYDSRNESLDWAQAVREAIGQTKPNFVVMMLGLHDRQAMRERPLQSGPAGTPNAGTAPPLVPQAGGTAQPGADTADTERPPTEQQAAPAAEPQAKPGQALRTYEFRTEEWAEHYGRRIDQTIAALKSAGVPVFWVGLPAVRGTKSTAEMLYLNDLFRTRAEKAGLTYVDVWDGFVDENGRFAVQGPDFEGQIRRLRVSDGVHFTKAGARKLAHFVEREIRRSMSRGTEIVALPSEPQLQAPAPRPDAPTARPLSGPVLPLTASVSAAQELLGAGNSGEANPGAVTRVLIKGEPIIPPAGRSDDFRWPRRSVAPFGTDPVVAITTDPVPVVAAPAPAVAAAPTAEAKPAPAASSRRTSRPPQQAQQQPQAQPRRNPPPPGGGGGGFFPFGR